MPLKGYNQEDIRPRTTYGVDDEETGGIDFPPFLSIWSGLKGPAYQLVSKIHSAFFMLPTFYHLTFSQVAFVQVGNSVSTASSSNFFLNYPVAKRKKCYCDKVSMPQETAITQEIKDKFLITTLFRAIHLACKITTLCVPNSSREVKEKVWEALMKSRITLHPEIKQKY